MQTYVNLSFLKTSYTLILLFMAQVTFSQVTTMQNDSLYNAIKKTLFIKTNNNLYTVLKQIDALPKYTHKKAQWQTLAGDIFRKNNQHNKALNYYKKAYRINQYNNDSVALMRDHIKIGLQFQKKLNTRYDSLYTNASLQLKDSALHYYNKNIQQYQRVKKGAPYIAAAYQNLAYILSDYGQYKKSDLYINKAIAINKTLYNENHPEFIGVLNVKALLYIYQEKYHKAIALEKLVLQKATDTSNIKVLDKKRTALNNLQYIYKKTNNYKKAYTYVKKRADVTDAIQQKQKTLETKTIEAKYNVAKATQRAKYNAEKAIQKAQLTLLKTKEKQKRTQNYAIIGGLAAVSILLFITILYRNEKIKRRNASLTLTKQKLNQEKILRAVTEENQNNIINATLDGREKERHEIALTLHDSFGSLFTAVNMHLQVFKVKNNITSNEIEKAQNMISEAAEKARNLSHKLISTNLIKYGLEHTFDDMCEKYSNSQISFELESENLIPRFNDTFERRIHNIVEECMNNILKHSKANEVNITMVYKNSILHTSITDNGIGFNTNKTNPNAGIGLGQIKARINSMQGEYNIKSILNEGTKISLDVPVAIRT
jgi:signal transduction histidine kinase